MEEPGNTTPAEENKVSSEVRRGPQLVVIDDDDLSRDVLSLIAMEAGFEVQSFASGEDAVGYLREAARPSAILADMQMPGISGQALGEELRSICGKETVFLAMSGSQVAPEKRIAYDGFLLKPFSADELKAACARTPVQNPGNFCSGAAILSESVFENFARSMPAGQVFGLYKLCLDDSSRRLTIMRRAIEMGDDATYRRAAHAIKGGCGMVGAIELAQLAAAMESTGLPPHEDVTPLDHFLTAAARLERMLDIKQSGSRIDTTVRP